ncbi:unannotated protein [freshwater metagenome]|uniref:Unannotated protein n=1 Tax=freshwater metagenome TaxID=449393 RepID=A0A6J5ZUA1_9ZZZZ
MGSGPTNAGHAETVCGVLKQQTIIRNHWPEDDDAAFVNKPFVTLQQLAIVLARKSAGVSYHELNRASTPDALIHSVFDRQNRWVDPIGEKLIEVHINENADLDRLEGIALCFLPSRGRVDGDVLNSDIGCRPATLPPELAIRVADSTFEVGASSMLHIGDCAISLGDPMVEWGGEHSLCVLKLAR